MRGLLTTASLLVSGVCLADTAAVRVLESSELSAERQRRLAVSAEVALKELSGFQVVEGGKDAIAPPPKGAERTCAQSPGCALELARRAGTRQVLLLSAKSSGGRLVVDGQLIDAERKTAFRKQVEAGSPSEPEAAAKVLVEAILPPWGRKGWAGLEPGEGEGAVKVDGQLVRRQPQQSVLPIPAGRHEVDVLLGGGKAVLQRLDIAEGSRIRLSAAALPRAELAQPGSSLGTLRLAGYGGWTAGVLCVAGSFVSGALANQSMSGIRPCTGDDRSCTSAKAAEDARLRAQSYAGTANTLLGVGLGLSLVGAGLVTYDLVQ